MTCEHCWHKIGWSQSLHGGYHKGYPPLDTAWELVCCLCATEKKEFESV